MKRAGDRGFWQSDTYGRRLLCALLSVFVPGSGQFIAGARRRGLVMLGVVVLLLICGIVIALQGVDQVLAWAIEPNVLLALLVLNVVLLGFRLFAVIDAYGIRRDESRDAGEPAPRETMGGGIAGPRAGSHGSPTWQVVAAVAGMVVLLLLTLAPHAAAGYYTYLSHDVLTTVFVSGDDSETRTTSAPSTTVTSLTTCTSTTIAGATTTTTTRLSTSTSTSQAPPDTDPPLKGTEDQRLTILFVGTDAGYGRTGYRADTIVVATFDLETGRVALFGIPRNMGSVPLSEDAADVFGKEVWVDLINSLYWRARDHPGLVQEGEDSGAVALRDTVSMLLGIPVEYYAVVDMGGFVEVVDALGGVTVNVETRLYVELSPPTPDEEWRTYDIPPGKQHLSGLEALAFARSRKGSSDYARMGRQRCVIAALLDQNGMAEMLWRLPLIARVIKESVRTDIPIDSLQELIRMRSELKTDEMITIGFTPPDYTAGLNSLGYYMPDVEEIQAAVRHIIEHPEEVIGDEAAETGVDPSDCWKVD